MERAAAGEMTTREAVAYLNEWLDFPISTRALYAARSAMGVPEAEKRGRWLVFRASVLDAFLAEFGTDPMKWYSGFARGQINSLRARGINDPQIEGLIRAIDPDPDGWRPDDAHT